MKRLADSNVVFLKDTHQYFFQGKELHGITSTIIPAVCGDPYEHVSDSVLAIAGERGTGIHEECHLQDDLRDWDSEVDTYEAQAYKRLCDERGLTPIASEYIVTDGQRLASPIDVVYEGDIIADIKTTSELHITQVRLQLSWYAAMYERMNGRKVQRAYVIWIPKESYGEPEMIELPLVPANIITAIVNDYFDGEDVSQYVQHFVLHLPTGEPDDIIIARLKDIEARIAMLQATAQSYRDELTTAYKTLGMKSYKSDTITITYMKPQQRITVDSKALKEQMPDVFAKYARITTVKDSIRIKVK